MIYLILAVLLYTAVSLLGAFSSRRIDTNLVAVINNVFSIFVPLFVTGFVFAKKGISYDRLGIIAAVVTGLLLGLFVMALTKSYAVNKVGIVVPVVFGGSIFLSTALSLVLFKEKITLYQGVGLILLGLGFAVLIYSQVADK